jgi:peptidoglycan-associated lipoprotein
MLMGLGAAGWLAGCNPRDLTISVTDRAYVAPPKPKVEAKPETPPPPTEIVREAEVAPPQPALAAASAARDLGDVYFDYDRYDIRSDDKSVLDAAIGTLKTEKERKLVIEGHCDERGPNEYNLILGERRAKAVKQYLVKSGISGSRIHPTSYGKERPVCLEHLTGCWKKNRRAHLVLE